MARSLDRWRRDVSDEGPANRSGKNGRRVVLTPARATILAALVGLLGAGLFKGGTTIYNTLNDPGSTTTLAPPTTDPTPSPTTSTTAPVGVPISSKSITTGTSAFVFCDDWSSNSFGSTNFKTKSIDVPGGAFSVGTSCGDRSDHASVLFELGGHFSRMSMVLGVDDQSAIAPVSYTISVDGTQVTDGTVSRSTPDDAITFATPHGQSVELVVSVPSGVKFLYLDPRGLT
jgi:hypothetical protein